MRIILASASPRRAELLRRFDIVFEVQSPDIDEETEDDILPQEYVRALSLKKAENIYSKNPQSIVIAADTTVVLNNEIINKPNNKQKAFTILKKLSGNEHRVLTGVTVMDSKKTITEYCSTSVFFKQLSDKEINSYIDTGEPMDKAGAYGIQGFGSVFVEKIEGCFFNVVGLPLNLLYEMLKNFDVNLL